MATDVPKLWQKLTVYGRLTEADRKIYEEAYDLVYKFFEADERKTSLWFRIPNLNFGNCSPDDLFEKGRGHRVLGFIKDAVKSNEPA